MRAGLDAGWAVLARGGSALDAAVATVAALEATGTFNAGRGAVPTTAGTVETDAAVMGLAALAGPGGLGRGGPTGSGASASDDTLREVSGALCAMTWPEHPIHAAHALALDGRALLLAGSGADAFAAEVGMPRRDEAALTGGGQAPVSEMGTVGAVALDASGHLAAATSTGGRKGQPPGRVGDSPVIGAGTWAAEGSVAVSATGAGEAFVRAGFAHRIDLAVAGGADLEAAVRDALGAVRRWGGCGGAVVLGADGLLVVAHDTDAMARAWRSADTLAAEVA
jgi:beta-aspartyl-peptidase (threonine type)